MTLRDLGASQDRRVILQGAPNAPGADHLSTGYQRGERAAVRTLAVMATEVYDHLSLRICEPLSMMRPTISSTVEGSVSREKIKNDRRAGEFCRI
jgi:hypothetical protein